jgi:hypothetical protein
MLPHISGKRIGAYIDELAFRIINGLVARLMLENTSAFMALVGGALVNNTAHVSLHVLAI